MSKKGVPLLEALELYSDPELWNKVNSMKDRGELLALFEERFEGRAIWPADYVAPLSATWNKLEGAFLTALRTGELIATGHDKSRPLRALPMRIPPELWNTLRPNFKESSAAGGGIEIAGVLVRSKEHPTARAAKKCEEWFKRRVAERLKPASRKSMCGEARALFGNGFSERAFDRTWRRFAPENWKKGGRKPQQKRGSVDADCPPFREPT